MVASRFSSDVVANDVCLSCWMSKTDYEQLKLLAKANGVSISAMGRLIIKQALREAGL